MFGSSCLSDVVTRYAGLFSAFGGLQHLKGAIYFFTRKGVEAMLEIDANSPPLSIEYVRRAIALRNKHRRASITDTCPTVLCNRYSYMPHCSL